jgi:hypothetical protein
MTAATEVSACTQAVGPHGAVRLSKMEKLLARLARTPGRPVRFLEVAKTGESEPLQGNLARGNAHVTSDQ